MTRAEYLQNYHSYQRSTFMEWIFGIVLVVSIVFSITLIAKIAAIWIIILVIAWILLLTIPWHLIQKHKLKKLNLLCPHCRRPLTSAALIIAADSCTDCGQKLFEDSAPANPIRRTKGELKEFNRTAFKHVLLLVGLWSVLFFVLFCSIVCLAIFFQNPIALFAAKCLGYASVPFLLICLIFQTYFTNRKARSEGYSCPVCNELLIYRARIAIKTSSCSRCGNQVFAE
jgi:ribosomal protein L37AE/L43A